MSNAIIVEGSSPRLEEPALSFQVYSPGEAQAPRPTARSSASDAKIPAPGMSLGLRVCLFLVGLCVVVGTASAIVAVSTDDPPPKPAATTPANPPPVLVSTGTLPLVDPNGVPPVTAPVGSIVIDPPAPSGTPTPVAGGAGAAPAGSGKKPIGSPPVGAPKSSAPPNVRGAAPPPNPYAGAGAKPAPKK